MRRPAADEEALPKGRARLPPNRPAREAVAQQGLRPPDFRTPDILNSRRYLEEELLPIADGGIILKQPILIGQDVSTRLVAERFVGAEPRRDVDVVGNIFGDARVEAQAAAKGLRDAAAEEIGWQRDDGDAEREGFERRVAAAVRKRVEHDVNPREEAQELAPAQAADERDPIGHVRH